MPYKHSISSVNRAVVKNIRGVTNEATSSILNSYRTSKFTFLFQAINIFLLLYLSIFIIPEMHLEKVFSLLQGFSHSQYAILMVFVYFVFQSLMGLFSTKSFGISGLLHTNLTLTLTIFVILVGFFIVYKLFFVKAKTWVKILFKSATI